MRRSASRTEILIVEVDDLIGYKTCRTDEILRHEHAPRPHAHARGCLRMRCGHNRELLNK